mmetsp:Transcript_84/g.199  ORF Transcript_84/g.199 Transcript_84/m.199 type:complete len:318 (-) Transcript_84:578-1531(-)|eukprot:CAMPEP_0185839728 /NCGR_PEP_ID=MMETSP1353-20130828/15066_1 /TAXON_ID=1077150 /ORGANISM="Erythrolobus australicus, Strain CCMP3124" /LENGTH=317 /DNA_ID=CAMNT_0028538943 /DNA_START=353 /DNA_END=1306 /DNA_ORIENTATION=-
MSAATSPAAESGKSKLESLQKGNYFVKDGLAYDGNKYKLRSPRERDRLNTVQSQLYKPAVTQQHQSAFRRVAGVGANASAGEDVSGPSCSIIDKLPSLDLSDVEDVDSESEANVGADDNESVALHAGHTASSHARSEDDNVAAPNVAKVHIAESAQTEGRDDPDESVGDESPTAQRVHRPSSAGADRSQDKAGGVRKLMKVLSGRLVDAHELPSCAEERPCDDGPDDDVFISPRRSIVIERMSKKEASSDTVRRHGLLSPRRSAGLAHSGEVEAPRKFSSGLLSPRKKAVASDKSSPAAGRPNIIKRASSRVNFSVS